MTSEFTCDLACGDVPQDHRLIRAAGANLAVVIGTVGSASETQCHFSQGAMSSWAHLFSIFSFLSCLQLTLIFHAFWCYISELASLTRCAGGCDNSLTYQHPEPRIRGRCMSSAGSLDSHSTALEICHCHKTVCSSRQLTKQGDMRQRQA